MEQRLLKHIHKTETCWLWTGAVCGSGYGQVYISKGKNRNTHRVAYEIWKGTIPDGMLVRHACNNKVCVNPEHLITGTQTDNMADMVSAERHGRKKLTHQQVGEIRANTTMSCKALGNVYNVSSVMISLIQRGKVWKEPI